MDGAILQSDELSWKLGKEIGGGGFGVVYEAVSQEDKKKVAIKLIPKSKGARRELLFEDLSDAENIVNIIATGEYEERYFIVMDLASISLRDVLRKGSISTEDSMAVIRDIAKALESIRNRVVHRDIKPDNILQLENAWCLSDFGIARFIEQTTSTETFKRAHSAPYTAPERWRGERATPASDVYSLGITAYEILEGKLPFIGSDLGAMHQNSPIPPFSDNIDHRLAKLVSSMLSKTPQMRPTPSRILEIIASIGAPSEATLPAELVALQNASKVLSSLRQQEEAEAEKRRLTVSARTDFIAESKLKMNNELQHLKDTLEANAAEGKVVRDPSGVFFANSNSWDFSLGGAEIAIKEVSGLDPMSSDGANLPFDVTAYTTIKLIINGNVVRSHSIWFSDMISQGDYGCYEVAFMEIFTNDHNHQPFALLPTDSGVNTVFRPVIGGYQMARNPLRIEDSQGDFVSRWVQYLVAAVDGSYRQPSEMPEEPIRQNTRR